MDVEKLIEEAHEHALDIAKERDAARAELAEECQLTDDASRLVVLCLDALGEDVARLANEPYEANRLNSLRRGIPDRIKALRVELARLTTPRPIAEAPRDGTRILAYMPSTETWMVLVWLVRKECWACPDFPHVGYYDPAEYLPLPEVKP